MTSNLFRQNILALCSAWALTLGMGMSPSQSQAQEAPKVKIATNMGDIMVELYPDKQKIQQWLPNCKIDWERTE